MVDPAQAAHDELAANGVAVSDVEPLPWGTLVYFQDPDGNAWSVHEPTARS
ncbi:MAG TPA: VOC family protein [Acidimicrobiales bacterium]|nr:VOC family protein [Acidimicrobiales bacterium]